MVFGPVWFLHAEAWDRISSPNSLLLDSKCRAQTQIGTICTARAFFCQKSKEKEDQGLVLLPPFSMVADDKAFPEKTVLKNQWSMCQNKSDAKGWRLSYFQSGLLLMTTDDHSLNLRWLWYFLLLVLSAKSRCWGAMWFLEPDFWFVFLCEFWEMFRVNLWEGPFAGIREPTIDPEFGPKVRGSKTRTREFGLGWPSWIVCLSLWPPPSSAMVCAVTCPFQRMCPKMRGVSPWALSFQTPNYCKNQSLLSESFISKQRKMLPPQSLLSPGLLRYPLMLFQEVWFLRPKPIL